MVQIMKLDHLEYKEAILDSPEFRDKLKRHEKHITDTSKNIKLLLKKFEDVLTASEALRNAQDSFSTCLKEFEVGFVGETNEEESDIVDTLECTYNLFQEIKEFSTKMINTGHHLVKQLENFRKEKIDSLKEKKKDYERQTGKYCTTLEKYLQSQYSKRDKNTDEYSEIKETDKSVKDENQLFYQKCLDYVLCIQEFEEKWFHFFSESIFAFVQSCTTFYHESYEKHIDCVSKYNKSQGGIQALAGNFEYFKSKSKELISDILKDPDYIINSYQTFSVENNLSTSKQGYLYLLEKKTLGSSTRVKQFCKYFKEIKRFEVITYNQTANKIHQAEVYFVANCQKSVSDKRFVFDLTLRDKNSSNVFTYQALSYEDYKAWFAIMEGKELTPVLSTYSTKTDPIYMLDKNGINFIKKCIQILEDEKINEEGIYRKNGVSHKINQFIEKNFSNLSLSTLTSPIYVNEASTTTTTTTTATTTTNGSSSSPKSFTNETVHNTSSSFISNVLKSANFQILSNSSSFSTLNFLASSSSSSSTTHQQSNESSSAGQQPVGSQSAAAATPTQNQIQIISSSSSSSSPSPQQPGSNLINSNNNSNSNSNLNDSLDDTCTITSALKHYLIHLKEPLMTYAFNQQFLAACRKENFNDRVIEIHKLLHQLPIGNFEAIELIMKHLNKISKHSQQNKMTTSNLATCFGPTIFRAEQESVSNLYNIKFYAEIVELLIVNCEEMFKPNLDQSFLQSLTPLKTPPTMLSSTLQSNNISLINNNNNSTISTPPNSSFSINNTNNNNNNSLPPSNKNRFITNNSSSSSSSSNKRAVHELSYRTVLMNSSKTSVSSDSSQSDRELQVVNGSTMASPLSTSSPNQHQKTLNQSTINENLNTTSSTSVSNNNNNNNGYTININQANSNSNSIYLNNMNISSSSISNGNKMSSFGTTGTNGTSSNPSSNSSSPKINGGGSAGGCLNTSTSLSYTTPMQNKLAKPYNSQTNQFISVDSNSTNSMHRLAISNNTNNSNILPYGLNVATRTYSSSPLNTKSTNINQQNQTLPSSTPITNSNTSLNSSYNHLSNLSIANIENLNNTNKPRRARTLFPCEADNPSELSFEANVIISNVRRSKESGWLEATYNGKSGLVPGNYVQILDD